MRISNQCSVFSVQYSVKKRTLMIAIILFSLIFSLSSQEKSKSISLKKSDVEAPELTEKAEKAIDRGLKYLIASQNPDGSWSSAEGSGYAIAGTSLGLMAFMAEGRFSV